MEPLTQWRRRRRRRHRRPAAVKQLPSKLSRMIKSMKENLQSWVEAGDNFASLVCDLKIARNLPDAGQAAPPPSLSHQ